MESGVRDWDESATDEQRGWSRIREVAIERSGGDAAESAATEGYGRQVEPSATAPSGVSGLPDMWELLVIRSR